jgi:ABC-2 type transport system permease protein
MRANPVIVKELRGRMRGWGAVVVLTIYLLVVSGVALLFYSMFRATSGLGSSESSQVGKFLFGVIVIFQLLMVFLLTPAFTAGAITSEKERKTYDVLMTTLLLPRSIIFGKLGAAVAYVALLILALAPLESLSFMFGGVSPEEIILSQVVMLAAALLFASIGIFWSTVVRSSVGSNVLTYGTIMVQLVLIPVLYWLLTSIIGAYYNPNGPPLATTEPFIYASGIILSSQPLIAMIFSETFLLNGDPLFIYTNTTISPGHTILVVSPWLLFCIEAVLASALLVLLSIRFVQPVKYGRGSRGIGDRGYPLAGVGVGDHRPTVEVPTAAGPHSPRVQTHDDASVPGVETRSNTPVQ